MTLQQSLDHYYQALIHPLKNSIDPRLNTYFLDIHDLVLLITQQIETAIDQQLIPAIRFKIRGIKEINTAFITIIINGGLDDFPLYKPEIIAKWIKKGIPVQNGIIDSAWYSKEFQCLEKILAHFIEQYNFTTEAQHFGAKRYWTMSEIDEVYEEGLMRKAVLM